MTDLAGTPVDGASQGSSPGTVPCSPGREPTGLDRVRGLARRWRARWGWGCRRRPTAARRPSTARAAASRSSALSGAEGVLDGIEVGARSLPRTRSGLEPDLSRGLVDGPPAARGRGRAGGRVRPAGVSGRGGGPARSRGLFRASGRGGKGAAESRRRRSCAHARPARLAPRRGPSAGLRPPTSRRMIVLQHRAPTRWLSRALRGSCVEQDAPAEQVEVSAAEHLAFDHLEAGDLTLGLGVAPRSGEGSTCRGAAARLGVNEMTVRRWRRMILGARRGIGSPEPGGIVEADGTLRAARARASGCAMPRTPCPARPRPGHDGRATGGSAWPGSAGSPGGRSRS